MNKSLSAKSHILSNPLDKHIEVFPPELIFNDILANQTYEMTVYVKNLTKTAKRLRIFQPTTLNFRCDYDLAKGIAPGLAQKLLVSFETSRIGEFHDTMKVVSDNGFEIEVKLHAYPLRSQIIFEPFLNLGFIQVNKEKIEQILFRNEGKSVGKVELKFDKLPDTTIDPNFFTIQPSQEVFVRVAYRPREAGIMKGKIEVIVDGQSFQHFIEVNSITVDYNRFFIDENGQIVSKLDFGMIYYGDTREKTLFLLNNTPKTGKFQAKLKSNKNVSQPGFEKFQTPHELGFEELERVLTCSPNLGNIEPYSQTKLKIICNPKITEKTQIWAKHFVMMKEEPETISERFSYTGTCEFDDQSDEEFPNILIVAQAICPQVKISTLVLNFGECPMNDRRDLEISIENKNLHLPIDYDHEKISAFKISPCPNEIAPKGKIKCLASFLPKSLGTFLLEFELYLLGGQYKIPMKLYGKSSTMLEREVIKRGVETLPEDFKTKPKIIEDDKFEVHYNKKKRNNEQTLLHSFSVEKIESMKQENPLLDEETLYKELNKQKYNKYVRDLRKDRIKKTRDNRYQSQRRSLENRFKEIEMLASGTAKTDEDLEEDTSLKKTEPPIDYEFIYGPYVRLSESPKLQNTTEKDTLFVSKPIKGHEPLKTLESQRFVPNILANIKKPFPERPRNHAEMRDCAMDLDAKQLQKVFAGPKSLKFGVIYIKSVAKRCFTIRNDLKTCILARLFTEYDELKDTYQRPQIIPTMETAHFEVSLSSPFLQDFKGTIKYIINEKYTFEFLVTATVECVRLDADNKSLKFFFGEDSQEMEVTEKFHVKNPGNDFAKFHWDLSENKVFSVEPKEGRVQPFQGFDFNIIYKPSGTSYGRPEEEKMVLKIEDGLDVILKCTGIAPESKCSIKESGGVDLGEIQISQRKEAFISLKNHLRHSTAYQIVKDFPDSLEISPMRDKLHNEENKSIKLSFFSKEEIEIKDMRITILLKGGKTIQFPFSVKTILPKVEIIEQIFDFGCVTTLGNPGVLAMTLRNFSNIKANLILDLRESMENPHESSGLDCLEVELIEPAISKQGDSTVIVNIDQSEENEKPLDQSQKELLKQVNEIDIDEPSENSSSDGEDEGITNNYQRISINSQQTLIFHLKFSPQEVQNYSFLLPLTLEGYGPVESLTRYITCEGTKPVLLIDPQIIDFKKKIISNDKYQAKKMEITLMNSDYENPVHFFFDVSDLETDKVFSLLPSEGNLKPGETITLEASFNPFTQMNYEKKAALFINGEKEKSYLTLTFKGNGAYPKLVFDRREIVMPVVPLGITSRCVFKIINDGFENLMIKHNFPKDIGFHLDINYLEGKNIGVTKNKLKIEALFSSKQPISFTTKLDFIDSDGRSYLIPISGTADNCIFTNFPYFQRTPMSEYSFKDPMEGPIKLEEVNMSDDNSENFSNSLPRKLASSVYSSKSSRITSKNIFGYNLVPNEMLSNSLEIIQRWLNHFVLSTQLQSFPDDVISSNGAQFFEFYTYISGKTFNGRAKFEGPLKKIERIELIIKQYESFIKELMQQGCLLGTIRPYYLLSFSDFNYYLKTHQVAHLNPSSFKPTAAQFSYLSADSWITLFYQIMKIYYLSRITMKSFKKQFPVQKFPEFYLQESNVYSLSEVILLRWLELYQPDPSCRLLNFDKELKNSICLSNVIAGYINTASIKSILNLKPECNGPEDYLFNGEKVLQALSFIGLETHMQAKNLAGPSARENTLFLIHIYQSLLHYIPKHDPIVFSCVLGQEVVKNIELKNPTKKVINYWVKYEGSKDFSIEGDNLRIEPYGKADYTIKFQSRIFEPVNGRLTFFNKRESNINAAAIVLDLISQITERKSLEVIQMQTPLYQIKQEVVTIKNIFTTAPLEFADFHISLLIDKIPKEDKNKNKAKNAKDNSSNKKQKNNKKNLLDSNNNSHSKGTRSPKSPKSPKSPFSHKGGLIKKGASSMVLKTNNSSSSSKESSPLNFSSKTESKQQILDFLMPTFIISKDKVHLKKGESTQVSLLFLPMVYENYRCRIICCDKEVGEFQIEVNAETLLPEPLTDIKPGQPGNPICVDTPIKYECPLPFRNESLSNAKKYHEGRLANTAKYKENIIKFKQITKNPDEILFYVELNPPSPYITLPETFLMKDPMKGTNNSAMLGSGIIRSMDEQNLDLLKNAIIENKLPMDFLFKFPLNGQQHNLILRSADNTDVRIHRLYLSIHPKMIKGTLKMKCAFGDELRQEIPFVNTTDRDWFIKANISWDTNKYSGTIFSGIRDFQAKRKSQTNFILHFHPQAPLERYEGKLSISNSTTNDHYEYEIIGITQEPISKGHIIIRCVAQTSEKRIIEIANPYKDRAVNFVVETDLINAIGLNKFTVEPGKVYKYLLTVTPLIGGVYTGSITFFEENDREKYIWYTVSVETEKVKHKGTIDLKAEIRKNVTCDIDLFNPLDENITFEVVLEGECLFGDLTISLAPKKAAAYSLTFLPLKVFSSKGVISFINEKIGEIWYELNLVSLESKTEKLPLIKAELGKSSETTIFLENPSFESASVRYLLSNTQNFSITTEQMEIPPLKELAVTIKYTPSDLDQTEVGEILFDSETIGKWTFFLSGVGTPPNKFPLISINSPIDKDLTQVVNFKNPLKEEISVQIFLKQDGGAFRLLMSKTKLSIAALTNYQIPYIFIPKGIKEYECEIIVYMNEKVQWVYPIKGFGEYVMDDLIFTYKAKSREVLNGDLKMKIPGVIESLLKKPFTLSIDYAPPEFLNAITRSLKILPVKNNLSSLDDYVKFKIIFTPLKPFKTTLDMLLTTAAGGRWKLKMVLEATEPEKDDVIQIYSPLHKTSSVSFKLANRFKTHADFKAYFTYDSDPEFSVIPKEGTLEPYGKDGSTFIVSFTPVEYGKNKYGKLIIETDEIYWSYIIRGTFPQYHPPESHSLISNRLGNEITERMKTSSMVHKNFLIENIKKSKWTSEEKKRFYNELGLEKSSTEISSIGKIADNSKDISSILIQEGSKDNILFGNKRDLLSGKFIGENEQSTKITADQSVSFRNKTKEKSNNSIFKSDQG